MSLHSSMREKQERHLRSHAGQRHESSRKKENKVVRAATDKTEAEKLGISVIALRIRRSMEVVRHHYPVVSYTSGPNFQPTNPSYR